MQKCLLIILVIATLVSCKKEIETTFIESDFNTDNHKNVHINVPVATGNTGVSEKINIILSVYVSKALQIGDLENKTIKSIEESVADFTNEFNTFKKDFPEDSQEWEAQIDGEVFFQSPEIITIATTSYINTGGAHGSLNISLLNFNVETGEKIGPGERAAITWMVKVDLLGQRAA